MKVDLTYFATEITLIQVSMLTYIYGLNNTQNGNYRRVPPETYSVQANATKPNMANLPFHISASDVMTPSDLDSALTPLNSGIKDATESRILVPRNHETPPLDI